MTTPNRITMHARPFRAISNMDNDFGIFAQDRWTMDRLTLNLALRFDMFQTSFPEQVAGPTPLTPGRNIVFPAQDNLDWKDITYRSGFSYDLTGTGRTALKVAFNKYLLGQTLNGIGRNPNPVLAMQTSTTRSWTDNNRNFMHDCDLLNPTAQSPATTGSIDTCGPWQHSTFGQVIGSQTYDENLRSGWGHRPSNWELSVAVQHEISRGIGVDVGYFRRIWKNFTVTDARNLDGSPLGPEAYTIFDMTAPTHAELGDFSGQRISGLVNLRPEYFGRVQQHNLLSEDVGEQIEHWDGFDVNLNARLQNGLMFQAGLSSGRTVEDDCDIVAKIPELQAFENNQRAAGFCRRAEPMQTSFKGYGVYTVPVVDVQVSGTYRNIPGTAINANFTATNAYLAANSTLGRPLAGGEASISVQLMAPNQKFTERRNELDVRFGKVLRFGPARSVFSVDVFNFLNTDAIVTVNQTFANNWPRPTEILNARLVNFSLQFDF